MPDLCSCLDLSGGPWPVPLALPGLKFWSLPELPPSLNWAFSFTFLTNPHLFGLGPDHYKQIRLSRLMGMKLLVPFCFQPSKSPIAYRNYQGPNLLTFVGWVQTPALPRVFGSPVLEFRSLKGWFSSAAPSIMIRQSFGAEQSPHDQHTITQDEHEQHMRNPSTSEKTMVN